MVLDPDQLVRSDPRQKKGILAILTLFSAKWRIFFIGDAKMMWFRQPNDVYLGTLQIAIIVQIFKSGINSLPNSQIWIKISRNSWWKKQLIKLVHIIQTLPIVQDLVLNSLIEMKRMNSKGVIILWQKLSLMTKNASSSEKWKDNSNQTKPNLSSSQLMKRF